MRNPLALLKRELQPRPFAGLLIILVGLLVGVLGGLGHMADAQGTGAPSATASVHVWTITTIIAYTAITVGFIVLVAAVLRMIADSLAAR
jgi:hypothetical protein